MVMAYGAPEERVRGPPAMDPIMTTDALPLALSSGYENCRKEIISPVAKQSHVSLSCMQAFQVLRWLETNVRHVTRGKVHCFWRILAKQ